jgi:hypothetical protein
MAVRRAGREKRCTSERKRQRGGAQAPPKAYRNPHPGLSLVAPIRDEIWNWGDPWTRTWQCVKSKYLMFLTFSQFYLCKLKISFKFKTLFFTGCCEDRTIIVTEQEVNITSLSVQ